MALTKIKTSGIADNAITNAKMADDAIDSADFADGSIDNVHLAGSIAVSKTLLAGGTGLTLSTNTLAVDAAQTQITSVGTIGTGVWNGTAVASSYLDSDTAHLSVAQTYTENITVDHSASANLILDGGTDAHSVISWKIAGTQVGIIGYDNTDNILKWVAGDSGVSGNANGMYLNSSGNVGIGVSPSRTLHVEASVNDEYLVKFKNTHASAGYGVQILAGDSSSEKILTLQDKDGNDKQLFYADGSATFAGKVNISTSNNVIFEGTSTHAADTYAIFRKSTQGGGNMGITLIGNRDSAVGDACAINFQNKQNSTDNNLAKIISNHTSSNAAYGSLRFLTYGSSGSTEGLNLNEDGNATFAKNIYMNGTAAYIGTNSTGTSHIQIRGSLWSEPHIEYYSYSNYNYKMGSFGTSSPKKFLLKQNNGDVIWETGGNNSMDVWFQDNVSAGSFTDRTPYPLTTEIAYDVLESHKKFADYDVDDKQHQLDHSKLHEFARPILTDPETDEKFISQDGRDASAVISCLVEVVNDLTSKVTALENA